MSTPVESLGRGSLSVDSPANIHMSKSIVTGLVILTDIFIIAFTGFVLYEIYLTEETAAFSEYLAVIGLYSVITIQAFHAAGLYRFNRIVQPGHHARSIPVICAMTFLAIIAVGFALKVSADFSRVWSFAWIISTTILLLGARYVVRSVVRKAALAGKLNRNIIVYGCGQHGQKLIEHIQKLDEPWNRIVGIFDDRETRIERSIGGYPILGNLEDMLEYGRLNRSDEVLIALPWNSQDRILQIVRVLTALPANIRLSSEIMGQGLIRQRVSYKFGVPMVDILDKPVSGWGALSKSLLDFILASLFALFALPLMAVIALLIKLESKGPVFFKQQRYGFNNQLIEVYKFRSMYTDMLDADADKLTTRNDPRVTRVGAFLRRTSMDELPQLINVLKGEMSVVGPRPHAMKAKAGGRLYEDVVDGYAIRHKVKPGITGWAQVNGWRGNTDTEQDITGRLEHDFYYIDNWSILFDLYIILQTAKVVASGENAY